MSLPVASKLTLMLSVLHRLEEMRRREQWPRPRIMAYQQASLRRLRDHAYMRSPFYQKFHRGLFDCPLSELPVLTKAMMMEHFDEIVTDRQVRLEDVRAHVHSSDDNARFLNRYRVAATSGSSGQPGFFLYDDEEWTSILASFARGQEWAGQRLSLTRRRRMASVASISPWHVSSQVAQSAKSWWIPAIRLAASEPLPDIVRQLNGWQPDVLVAYASMSRILAEEQLAGRLHIQPEFVYTSSEVLTAETRRRVKEAWGREPFNEYGATETANIAAERSDCRRLHVYEDMVILEAVDEQYRPVPPGEYGAKVLVTSLFSRTQPLIRYEINDSVRLVKEECPSGRSFTVLESIQGRVEDILHLPACKGGRVAVQPLVFNRVMDVAPVSGWQVVQEEDDSLTVLLSGLRNDLVDQTLIDALTGSLSDQGAAVPGIRVRRVEAIPKAPSGKAPLIKARRTLSSENMPVNGSGGSA